VSIDIRRPKPSEEDVFVKLSCSLTRFNLEHGPELHEEEDVMEAREKRARQLFRKKDPEHVILFAELDGEIVGYVMAHIYRPSLATETLDEVVGNVDELYVKQNIRAQGVGRRLLDSITEWIKEKGATSMTLRMYAWNEGAKQFYEKEGFSLYDVAWHREV
jgi:GNAT superfamily N-acetyltransferase